LRTDSLKNGKLMKADENWWTLMSQYE
jgi:hypothetical protein